MDMEKQDCVNFTIICAFIFSGCISSSKTVVMPVKHGKRKRKKRKKRRMPQNLLESCQFIVSVFSKKCSSTSLVSLTSYNKLVTNSPLNFANRILLAQLEMVFFFFANIVHVSGD